MKASFYEQPTNSCISDDSHVKKSRPPGTEFDVAPAERLPIPSALGTDALSLVALLHSLGYPSGHAVALSASRH